MNVFREAKRIVIKVGTAVLTGGGEELDIDYMASLARQIVSITHSITQRDDSKTAAADEKQTAGRIVTLVSSGAIRAGKSQLGLIDLHAISEKQAAAAVGQVQLMSIYRDLFWRHGVHVAQVLLTRDDVAVRQRFLNARNTFQKLFEWGVLPIVNENDTVATEEIKFGDNDQLAALVGLVIDADLVIMLSDVDGFYLPSGKVDVVTQITDEMMEAAEESKSGLGTGGMYSKLQAAKVAMDCGIPLVIAHGRHPDVLERVISGEAIGTLFIPRRRLPAKKRWLAYAPKTRGRIVVNEGAMLQILHHGKSLLPAGVIAVEGKFDAGDVVALTDEHGRIFAKGMVAYNSDELRRVAGLHTSKIESVLGYKPSDEVVHRNNLVIV
ncbi:MAG: glutamate 5-kinase [Armatimonadota bacterium]|nr:glutamate 5-kinase [Armatimonadota bacterium]MCX7778169.1 glutamate 5-kinase [Armatimonadota bacterium]MDW8026573.1 glutamate 5-kinase [Armatimonadota bacterium]